MRERYAVAAAVLAAAVAIHLANFAAGGEAHFLDSAWAFSYSHLLATLALAAGAVAGAYGAWHDASFRIAWLTLGAAHAFLLLDKGTRLHAQIEWWPVLYGPLFLALCVAGLAVVAGGDLAPVARAGLLLLVVSLAFHVVGPMVGRANDWGVAEGGPYPWPYQVIIAFKEGLELAGWALFTPAVLALARR